MGKLILNRRRLLGVGAASGASLMLAGCDQFDFLRNPANDTRNFIEGANGLTYAAQRALVPQQALARTFSESEMRQPQRPNGSTDPTKQNPDYAALVASNFAGYQLKIIGLVEQEQTFTLDQIRNMPGQSQVTRHDCVEGWSVIAKWTGVRLGTLLDQAKVKPTAKYVVYHCYDSLPQGFGNVPYYESCDLIDAFHPQTIAAYGLNNAALPVSNGAPIRIRIERALGYKQPKYVHTIELVDGFSQYGLGQGGYWEDNGYDWYGGI